MTAFAETLSAPRNPRNLARPFRNASRNSPLSAKAGSSPEMARLGIQDVGATGRAGNLVSTHGIWLGATGPGQQHEHQRDPSLAVVRPGAFHGAITVAEVRGDILGVQSWALTPNS